MVRTWFRSDCRHSEAGVEVVKICSQQSDRCPRSEEQRCRKSGELAKLSVEWRTVSNEPERADHFTLQRILNNTRTRHTTRMLAVQYLFGNCSCTHDIISILGIGGYTTFTFDQSSMLLASRRDLHGKWCPPMLKPVCVHRVNNLSLQRQIRLGISQHGRELTGIASMSKQYKMRAIASHTFDSPTL